MSTTSACPEVATLRQIIHGGLSPVEEAALESHLFACSSCVAAVRELEAADTLLQGGGQTTTFPDDAPLEEQVRELVSRLKNLQPPQPIASASLSQEAAISAPGKRVPGAHREVYDFLAPPQADDELGRLGHYRVLKVLGAGGMGVVFLAEDTQLRRPVALKAIKPAAAASPSAVERFLREARATAALKHDNVVTIYQVGEERGVPFLAMELLEGEPLNDRLERAPPLSIAEIVRIGRETAEGLAAAHTRGLMHRDIKPANLWLEKAQGRPSLGFRRVKILDFGLARAAAEDAQLTQQGTIVGTPAYMAPEQAAGTPLDHRCDLFSLGCVLYSLSTGQAPFRGTDTISTLMAVSTYGPPPPHTLNPDVPHALSELVMKLLAKKPGDRPESAEAVCAALEEIGKELHAPNGTSPVQVLRAQQAKATTESIPPLQTHRRVRRSAPRRLTVAAAVLLLIVGPLSLFFGGTVIRFATNKGELIIETDDKNIEVTIKDGELKVHERVKDRTFVLKAGDYDVEVRELGEGGVKFVTKRFSITRNGVETFKATVELAKVKPMPPPGTVPLPENVPPVFTKGNSPLDALDPAQIPAPERFPWQPKELVAVIGEHRQRHWGDVWSVAIRPDGKQAASCGHDQQIRLWDLAMQTELPGLPSPFTLATALAYSSDGKQLAVGSNGSTRVWNLPDGGAASKLHTTIPKDDYARYLAFTADAKTLVIFSHYDAIPDTVTLWDLSNDEPSLRAKYPACTGAALSPDGKTLAIAHKDGPSVRLYDLTEAKPKQRAVLPGKESRPYFAPDGRLTTQDPEANVRFWDVTGPEPKSDKPHKLAGPSRVTFAANGERMATVAEDGAGMHLQLWDVQAADAAQDTMLNLGGLPLGYNLGNYAFALSPNGKLLVTGHINGAVRFWEVAKGSLAEKKPVNPQPTGSRMGHQSNAVSPQGPGLISCGEMGIVRAWHFGSATPTELKAFPGRSHTGHHLAVTPDGKTLAQVELKDGNSIIRCSHFDGTKAREGTRLENVGHILAMAVSPDGKTLAYGTMSTDKIGLWDLHGVTPKKYETETGDNSQYWALSFSPDGRTLFSSGDKNVTLWSVSDGKLIEQTKIPYRPAEIAAQAVSPDGKTLALAGSVAGMEFWDLSEGKPHKRHSVVGAYPYSVAFSPDSKTLVATDRFTITIWEVATGRKLREWPMPGTVRWAAYAPDGRHIFTANSNGTIYGLRLAPRPEQALR